MYIKYSFGFLIASLVQAGIIYLTENLGLSTLDAKFTLTQLLVHIIAGQVAGYVLLYAYRKTPTIQHYSAFIVGIVHGLIVYAILIPVNSMVLNDINVPWRQGVYTLAASLIAFAVYGIITSNTIDRYGYKEAH